MAHQVNGVVSESKGAPVQLVPILVPDSTTDFLGFGPFVFISRISKCDFRDLRLIPHFPSGVYFIVS